MNFPIKITFPSDGTTAELKDSYKAKSGYFGVYIYLTGYYFKGKEIIFDEKHFELMLKRKIVKPVLVNK